MKFRLVENNIPRTVENKIHVNDASRDNQKHDHNHQNCHRSFCLKIAQLASSCWNYKIFPLRKSCFFVRLRNRWSRSSLVGLFSGINCYQRAGRKRDFEVIKEAAEGDESNEVDKEPSNHVSVVVQNRIVFDEYQKLVFGYQIGNNLFVNNLFFRNYNSFLENKYKVKIQIFECPSSKSPFLIGLQKKSSKLVVLLVNFDLFHYKFIYCLTV